MGPFSEITRLSGFSDIEKRDKDDDRIALNEQTNHQIAADRELLLSQDAFTCFDYPYNFSCNYLLPVLKILKILTFSVLKLDFYSNINIKTRL